MKTDFKSRKAAMNKRQTYTDNQAEKINIEVTITRKTVAVRALRRHRMSKRLSSLEQGTRYCYSTQGVKVVSGKDINVEVSPGGGVEL